MIRDNAKLVLLAATCLVIGLVAPATAAAVKKAVNSDKVDGLHAVKSSASVKKRRGKLVATSRKTGRLPNNIIAQAPDSARLGGVPATAFRSLVLPASALHSANEDFTGHPLADAGVPSVSAVVPLPPTYVRGRPLTVALDIFTPNVPCVVSLIATTDHLRTGTSAEPVPTSLVGGGNLAALPRSPGLGRVTVRAALPAAAVPGDVVVVRLLRNAAANLDACTGTLLVMGATLSW
ncbi:hypothetical protein [Nocardioides sp. SYSU D00038]|uniref:hypothetical protein n=1 Tax=Nocardioides sp. SYSU D00038 TaxID=2812554 RepID=UPI001966CE49|nr:hypothetical protein [Nocardioides sp. SYSU D00038]